MQEVADPVASDEGATLEVSESESDKEGILDVLRAVMADEVNRGMRHAETPFLRSS